MEDLSGTELQVNLNESKSANSFDVKNLIHQIAKKEFTALIDQRLKEIPNTKDDARIHETISILGGRGSGKSSLLLSMVDYIKQEHPDDIFVLKVTDPTLFENRQHILVTIIAHIQNEVSKHLTCNNTQEDYESLKNDWRKSLQKLAEGLNLLDNVGTDPMQADSWNSSTIILEKGLSQALSGESLEDNFYKFINKSLEVLNKKAILMAFDDIDTDFEKGEKILETLRKYFRYPKIITLVAGDMDLFSKIIRQKNWKQFEDLIKLDKVKKLDIQNNIDHLEDQYLLKVLPTRSRIMLKNIYTLLNDYSFNFTLRDNINEDSTKCILQKPSKNVNNDLFYQLNTKYFKIQSNHIKDNTSFLQALTLLPIRTVTQFIESFLANQKQYIDDKYFIKQILSLFSSTLAKFNIEPNQLESNENFIAILTTILIDLDQNDTISFNESYRLKPIYLDDSKRTIMLLLNIMTNRAFAADRSKVFEYFVKTGLTRELILGSDYYKKDIYAYKEFVGLEEQETPVKMTRRYVGFISEKFTKAYSTGFVKTYEIPSKIDQKLKDKQLTFTRKNAESELTTLKDQFLLNILFLTIKGKNGEVGSIFPLIAIMSEFTQVTTKDKLSFIEDQIRNYSQFRTFNAYKQNETISDEDDIDEDETDGEGGQQIEEEIVNDIKEWITDITSSQCSPLPIHILAKVWTRFYYSLENIVKSTRRGSLKNSFGDYIQLCIAQFLNSWIIETMLYLNQEVSLKNVNSSYSSLKSNYKKFKDFQLDENEKFYNFTKSILAFPLWKYYLPQDVCQDLYQISEKSSLLITLEKIAISVK